MGAQTSAFYDKICCGDSEDANDLESELGPNNGNDNNDNNNDGNQYPGDTPQDQLPDFTLPEEEQQRTALLTKKSNGALDSFLKHQFSELTPQIIKAQGLDPIEEVWKDEAKGLLFRASITLGPLSNLSQLTYDDLDLDELHIKYNEILHLNTNLYLSIKIRDTKSLNLGLKAEIGTNAKGNILDLGIPAKGTVRVIGVRVKCTINLVHSLDIEWNDRNKSIEGILNNTLSLKHIDITYDRIVVNLIKDNIPDDDSMTLTLWTQIEEAITGAVTKIFKEQITKLLNKTIKKEMEKVLQQINEETPRFEISFAKSDRDSGSDRDDQKDNTSDQDTILDEVGDGIERGAKGFWKGLGRLVK